MDKKFKEFIELMKSVKNLEDNEITEYYKEKLSSAGHIKMEEYKYSKELYNNKLSTARFLTISVLYSSFFIALNLLHINFVNAARMPMIVLCIFMIILYVAYNVYRLNLLRYARRVSLFEEIYDDYVND